MEPLYGPPPDPRQVVADVGFAAHPGPWIACVVIGLLLAALGHRRPLVVVVGLVVALTAPFAWYLPTYVYGSFPTIDKAGSLLFYLDGVHRRFFEPDDPALRLIGVHVGHLWISAALDLVLAAFAAFNAQMLLNLTLSWWLGARLLERLTSSRGIALLLAFPFAMNLHQFRDINWYTVEKTSIYWIPLYLLTLLAQGRSGALTPARRVQREEVPPGWPVLPALVLFGAFFTNMYVGILCAGAGAWVFLVGDAPQRRAVVLSALGPVPLVAYQWRLMHGAGSLGSPEQFLTERASLDVFTAWPPAWNRLEAWRALNLPALLLGVSAVRIPRARPWLGLAAITFALALGPTRNPLYLLLFELVPGFWRIAKPETFFHLTWLALLAAAALHLAALRPRRGALVGLAVAFTIGWLVSVRTHAVFPQFSLPVDVHLAADWQQAVPRGDNPSR